MYSINELRYRSNQIHRQLPENICELAYLKDRLITVYTKRTSKNLSKLLSSTEDEYALAQEVKEFLSKQWELINGTILAYTVLPSHDLTQLLCNLAGWAAEKLNAQKARNEEPHGALNLLMPTINVVSYHDDYPSLGPTQDFKTKGWSVPDINMSNILHTHILGRNGAYLIPISLLTALDSNLENQITFNPYFDYKQHDDALAKLSPEEINRLFNHSQLTQTMRDTLTQLQALLNSDDHLLGQLRQLCLQFERNNAYGGSGTESNAGLGAYPAIITFKNYYDQLDHTQKSCIPSRVKEQIDLILALSSDPTINSNATENIETCIAARGAKLLEAMRDHEEVLAQISTSRERKHELIKQTQEAFNSVKEQLTTALQPDKSGSKTYLDGYDSLGINRRLLEYFNIEIQFNSSTDLELLYALNPEEIKELCIDTNIAQKIMEQLNSVENLATFFIALSSQQLKAFMEALLDRGIFNLIKEPLNLVTLFDFQSLDRVEIILQSLDGRLFDIINSASCFNHVVKYLDRGRRSMVYEAMAHKLPNMIQSISDFGIATRYLTVRQKTEVCESRKVLFTKIISSANNLLNAVSNLNREQFMIVCASLKDELPRIIPSVYEFRSFILSVDAGESRTVVCEALKNLFPNICRYAYDFIYALKALNPEQCKIVCESMQARLPKIIPYFCELKAILSDLSVRQLTPVCEALKNIFPVIIGSVDDFKISLSYLNQEQCMVVCESLQSMTIISSIREFRKVIQYLSAKQGAVVCNAIIKRLPEIIYSPDDFMKALQVLSVEQRIEVYTAMQAKLPKMIRSAGDLRKVLEFLNPEQRMAVYEAIQTKLPKMIRSAGDLRNVLEFLNPEQRTAVYEVMKDTLPIIIRSSNNLKKVSPFLNPAQTQEAEQLITGYKLLKSSNNDTNNIIHAVSHHGLLLQHVDSLERASLEVIIAAVKSNSKAYQFLPDYLKNNESVFKLDKNNANDNRFGLPKPEDSGSYNKIQTICFLQRYIELRKKESTMHFTRHFFSFFHHNDAYTSKEKCRVAKKCISILEGRSTDPLTDEEKQTLNDGRLQKITACVQDKLYNIPGQRSAHLNVMALRTAAPSAH